MKIRHIATRYIRSTLICAMAMMVLCAGLAAGAQAQDRRWALVLGVSDYSDENIPSLNNTVNDSRTVAAALNTMGFKVYYLENPKKSDVLAVTEIITQEQVEADTGLFYFAGHGLQVAGENFALPSDIRPEGADFLQRDAVSVNDLIAQFNAIGTRSLVVILDSCRNSPFPGEEAIGTGLALVDAPDNTIIAYSTAPGAVALDGSYGNSPYTAALASALEGPEQDMRDVLRLVRARVRLATGGAQTPWFIDNTKSDIIIRPKHGVPSQELREMLSGRVISLPTTAWRTIADSADPRDFEQFAALFPEDDLANAAKRQLALVGSEGPPAFPLLELRADGADADIPGGLLTEITSCDILATGIGDVMAVAEPVAHDLINTRAALRACVEAVGNDAGNPRLNNLLAHVLRLDNRYDEALHFYEVAAALGNPSAYAGIATFYRQGIGVTADYDRAFEAAREGALKGSPLLKMLTGIYYREGWGTQQSFPEARRWIELAAETGFAPALVAYGGFYRKGLGVPKDPVRALEFYRRASALGSSDAANLIGRAYLKGQGVEKDTALGIQWLVRATEDGNPYAPLALGQAFQNGTGVEKDQRKALAYFRLSAQRNFVGAYNFIGDVLQQGAQNVTPNKPEAYANFLIAKEAALARDTRDSKTQLEGAEDRIARILPDLSAAQKSDGEARAAAWIAQYGILDFNLVNE